MRAEGGSLTNDRLPLCYYFFRFPVYRLGEAAVLTRNSGRRPEARNAPLVTLLNRAVRVLHGEGSTTAAVDDLHGTKAPTPRCLPRPSFKPGMFSFSYLILYVGAALSGFAIRAFAAFRLRAVPPLAFFLARRLRVVGDLRFFGGTAGGPS